MCGIFVSVNRGNYIEPSSGLRHQLSLRGPHDHNTIYRKIRERPGAGQEDVKVVAYATVLGLRGDSVSTQPQQITGRRTFLCWNGELWAFDKSLVKENDGEFLIQMLVAAIEKDYPEDISKESSLHKVLNILARCEGPFAFVLFDARHNRLIFGRDELGRRSLLVAGHGDMERSYQLASMRSFADVSDWKELNARGVFVHDISESGSPDQLFSKIQFHPWDSLKVRLPEVPPTSPFFLISYSPKLFPL